MTHTHTKYITFLSIHPLSRLPTIVAIILISNTVLFHKYTSNMLAYIQNIPCINTSWHASPLTGIRPSSRVAEASELLKTFFTAGHPQIGIEMSLLVWSLVIHYLHHHWCYFNM